MSSVQQIADFDIIRYANNWEDADVLLRALELKGGEDMLCICSAGDNALAMLSAGPKNIDAIDISLPQLYLAELKQLAFHFLEYNEVLQLLGHNNQSSTRTALFEKIKPSMSTGAAAYWSERKQVIETGLIHAGKFERYFSLFRKYFLPLVHGRKRCDQLLEEKTDAEQKRFYEEEWNNIRWKLLLSLFFSKWVMGKYGRDPAFLKHVNIPVGTYIRNKAEAHLRAASATRNGFLHYIYKGSFGNHLPFAYREENFSTIKQNIGRLNIVQASAQDAIRNKPYDGYALSNIFEYMSQEEFDRTVKDWEPFIPKQARLVYWNLMAPRSFAATAPDAFINNRSLAAELQSQDKGFFYSRLLIEQKC